PAAPALAAGTATVDSIQLNWTAVGDDGNAGTAASYDLRYATGATCPLSQSTFSSGVKVTLPAPQAAGSSESATVSGLAEKTAYSFRLKVADAAANPSYSASLAASTADAPAPSAAVLSAGATTGNSIQVTWTAVGDDSDTGTAASYDLRVSSGAGC